MKYLYLVILFILPVGLFAQDKPEKSPYDDFIKRFNMKMDTAIWLCQYDRVAWVTTDSIFETPKEDQQKLGAEWFCFEEGKLWHAVYGKFENGKYSQAYHYIVDTLGNISRAYNIVDTSITHPYSRSLQNSLKTFDLRGDSIAVRFNSYVKRNEDKTITVWLLPAFTQNGIAIYGGEFSYTFNPSGTALLKKNEYLKTYMGVKPSRDKEFWLDYEHMEEPTLGAVFFVWYYKSYFDRIVIDTKKFKSTVFHNNHDGYYWIHAAKDK